MKLTQLQWKDQLILKAELEDLSLCHREMDVTSKKSTVASNSSGSGVLEMLQDRLESYRSSHASAKSVGDSSKVRRTERGIKVSAKGVGDSVKTRHTEWGINPLDARYFFAKLL